MAGKVESNVFKCIDNKRSFIIEAGAGSGKTWTLVQSLFYIIENQGNYLRKMHKRIACITYTNVAKEEIIERIKADDLVDARTIHDFLWDIIKPFQKELKAELVNLIKEKTLKKAEIVSSSNPTTKKYKEAAEALAKYNDTLDELEKFKGEIQYREFYNRKNGIVSHNDILWLANVIIRNYPIIHKIIGDTYPIIFIDEYQDTDKNIAQTILETLKQNSTIVFGFFGDYNQQIYGGSIGKIDSVKYNLEVIPKKENYRCSIEVINLLNKLRNDITQRQTGDPKNGKCICYYVNDNEADTENIIKKHINKDFGLASESELKKLYLVTKTIAKKNGYFELHDLYDEENINIEHRRPKRKDQLLKNKDNRDCPFANFLYTIEEIVELFNENKIQALLKKTTYEISCLNDKVQLDKNIIELRELTGSETIKGIFEFVWNRNLLPVPEKLKVYFQDKELQDDFFNALMCLPYVQFRNLYYTVKKTSPFSTDHGTKGAEYDSVVCFIDDNDWNTSYNFNNYFNKTDEGKARFDKTKNLFYVICSRAKYNLAIVILSKLSDESINKLKLWFGEENFISI
ncbi:UvrD-helicase domain-containing protein [Dehalobacter sp. DCM]|uniref:UvrD-helicase domain-containing protein n=1 Tax=Dehalobacter sp. DCM TaxID=2907827 RepID=UPI0030817359|nr:UvrD-helicase domain-containing protein [Dehalobacter sp. DCM]